MDDIFLIISIIGIFIPLIFIILLLFIHHPNRRAKKILILGFILTIAGYSFELFQHLQQWDLAMLFFIVYIPILFVLYPMLYIYLKSIIWENIHYKSSVLLQYFSITLFITIVVWGYYLPLSAESKIDFLSIANGELPAEKNALFVSVIIIALYYLQACIFIYLITKIVLYINKTEKKKLIIDGEYLPRWTWILAYGIYSYEIIVSIIFIVFDMSSTFTMVLENTVFNIFMLFLGFFGIKQYDLTVQSKLKKLTPYFETENGARKTSNKLSPSQREKLAETITKYISEKKLYLDPNIKIEQLAKKLHVPYKNLSLVINEFFGKSFTTLLNEYRVTEAKNFILSADKIDSLEEIYTKVGFNSRSTFNRVFKTHTGFTPSEYMDSVKSGSLQANALSQNRV